MPTHSFQAEIERADGIFMKDSDISDSWKYSDVSDIWKLKSVWANIHMYQLFISKRDSILVNWWKMYILHNDFDFDKNVQGTSWITNLTGIFLDDTTTMVGRTKCLFEMPGPLLPFWCNIFKLRLRDVHELIQISSHGILLEVKTCEVWLWQVGW